MPHIDLLKVACTLKNLRQLPGLTIRLAALLFFIFISYYPQICWSQATVTDPAGSQRFNDFVGYWTASRLLLAGKNPYSAASLLELQRSIGLDYSSPFVMYSPPWILTFTWPFALVDYSQGQVLWLLLQTFLVFFSARRLWLIYGNSPKSYRIAWLAALTFTPLDLAVIAGQLSPLMLLGLGAFLYSEKKQAWIVAGLATSLIALKPHLLYLFWIALALWTWQRRLWQLAAGAIAGGVTIAIVPLIIHPSIYAEYSTIWHVSGIPAPYDWAVPTLGHALREVFQQHNVILLFLPSVCGIVWLVFYCRKYRTAWQWSERLPPVLLVSISTCAYFWTFDQALLFPAVIQGATWLLQRPKPFYTSRVAQVYMAINLLHIAMRFFITDEFWYFWMAPAFLVNYLILQKESAAASSP
jgi:glycosyl transferase family 87